MTGDEAHERGDGGEGGSASELGYKDTGYRCESSGVQHGTASKW